MVFIPEVYSERLFSEERIVYEEKQNRLLSKVVEKLFSFFIDRSVKKVTE